MSLSNSGWAVTAGCGGLARGWFLAIFHDAGVGTRVGPPTTSSCPSSSLLLSSSGLCPADLLASLRSRTKPEPFRDKAINPPS